MKIAFAIQHTHIQEKELFAAQMALAQINAPVVWFGLIVGVDQISTEDKFEDYDKVVAFGTVKMVRMVVQGKMPLNTLVFMDKEKFY